MAKLHKMYYYTSKKEKKLNCYYVVLKRELVDQAELNDEIEIKVENKKIIIKNIDKK